MEDIRLRLKEILKNQSINASEFAKKINVQRSSISHILNGRNKPSLEIVTKIFKEFPEIDVEWLIFGKDKQNPSPISNKNNDNSLVIKASSGELIGDEGSNILKIVLNDGYRYEEILAENPN